MGEPRFLGCPPAVELFKSDEKLAAIGTGLLEKYSKLADEASLKRTVASLEAHHEVTVVDTAEQALEIIKKLVPKGADVTSVGSTTLREIGYTELSMSPDAPWVDVRGLLFANKDPSKAKELRARRFTAEYSIGSASAISETGEIIIVDATATRVAPMLTTDKAIIVAGTNKITPTYEDAVRRTNEFATALESARAREVYKIPGSSLNYFMSINGHSPMIGKRIQIILVKQSLGY